MTYSFGATSRARKQGLHPHLVDILDVAIVAAAVDFAIICGLRTPREQINLYAQGRKTSDLLAKGIRGVEGKPHLPVVTWTLDSNHFMQDSGFGHAVDLCPYVNGALDWERGRDRRTWIYFPQIAQAMKDAADARGYPLEWGGDWPSPKTDGPHFQLPKDYPAPDYSYLQGGR